MQPFVQRLTQISICQTGDCTPALCVPTHYHLSDLEMCNSILDNTGSVDIICMYRVRDIAVYEDVARFAVTHGCLGDATVRTSYPKDLRCLTLRQDGECIWVFGGGLVGVVGVSCYKEL